MGRRIKRIDGAFTLEGVHQLKHADSICDSCGVEPGACDVRKFIDRLSKSQNYALIDVRSCVSFTPIIGFQDATGLDVPSNTFRLGYGYADRLSEGRIVRINKPLHHSYSRVTRLERGTFDEVEHLKVDNHLLIGREDASDVDFFEIVQGIYGPHLVQRGSKFTVIYLEPL